jgi:hypothetical protein
VMVREIISSKSKKSCHYRFQDGDDELWSRVIHEDLQLADRRKVI